MKLNPGNRQLASAGVTEIDRADRAKIRFENEHRAAAAGGEIQRSERKGVRLLLIQNSLNRRWRDRLQKIDLVREDLDGLLIHTLSQRQRFKCRSGYHSITNPGITARGEGEQGDKQRQTRSLYPTQCSDKTSRASHSIYLSNISDLVPRPPARKVLRPATTAISSLLVTIKQTASGFFTMRNVQPVISSLFTIQSISPYQACLKASGQLTLIDTNRISESTP